MTNIKIKLTSRRRTIMTPPLTLSLTRLWSRALFFLFFSQAKTFFLVFFLVLGIKETRANLDLPPVSQDDTTKRSLNSSSLNQICLDLLRPYPGPISKEFLEKACSQVQALPDCKSVQGNPIFHFDRSGTEASSKKILVFSLIHGDEIPAGTLGRFWMQRLAEVDPRNSWRIVPVLNPDGSLLKTRTNANKIDLNRNFPTRDWQELALVNWQKLTSSNPRRFPGAVAGSEPEVQCALKHISDFGPDFVVSIHSPLHVLDFDGPKLRPPEYAYLPWRSLGHFPGSLGRYLWFERETPVLTAELKSSLPSNFGTFEQLQDLIGTLVKTGIPKKTPPPPTAQK